MKRSRQRILLSTVRGEFQSGQDISDEARAFLAALRKAVEAAGPMVKDVRRQRGR